MKKNLWHTEHWICWKTKSIFYIFFIFIRQLVYLYSKRFLTIIHLFSFFSFFEPLKNQATRPPFKGWRFKGPLQASARGLFNTIPLNSNRREKCFVDIFSFLKFMR